MLNVMIFLLSILTIGCGRYIQIRDKVKVSPPMASDLIQKQDVQLGPVFVRVEQSQLNPEQFDLKVTRNSKDTGLVELDIQIHSEDSLRPYWATATRFNQVLDKPILALPFYQGDQIEIKVLCSPDGRRSDCGSHEFQLPTVFVVRESLKLTQDLSKRVDQIWFLNNPTIVTGGFKFALHAPLLMSPNGATIATLDDSNLISKSGAGKSLSAIEIFASRAVGSLKLLNKGQGGANGASGKPYESRAAKGSKGSPAVVRREYNPDIRIQEVICVKNHGDGHPGLQGLSGRQGDRGFAGGNTAPAYIEVEDAQQFQFQSEMLPGKGGKGGDGGPGQLGGLGGEPGDNYGNCANVAKSGPPGPNGPVGSVGLDGNEGQLEPFCFKIGATQQGRCQQR
jgi:hypothetical protein